MTPVIIFSARTAGNVASIPVEEVDPEPLITGHDLTMFTQGPLIGKLLRAVREKQLEGELVTKDGAMNFIRDNWYKYN